MAYTGSNFIGGFRLIDGDELNSQFSGIASAFNGTQFTGSDAITAHAGGGQASATPLPSTLNRVTVVATAADSVALPASAVGLTIYVVNSAANSMQVFGSGTDTINGVATGTGVAQAAGVSAIYWCPVAGKWFRVLSA